ncbi:MAG: Peptidase M14, carboxypeptidase A [uncultured Truepera sp.]|uniref:Peptidase M14, carboxypeptidase A n=1 Tax=uncultured Truepera sp. TaxID=543023 RepID=A0A6J4VL11_9DEIN|nr:MAG: Peptidase M14, carboxypeptidase A [uncultured Truepera sp.]
MDLDIRFDTYYDFDELTERLHALVAAYPELARLESLGKTHQGRDIWAVTLTNPDTGPAEHKPGYYLDAQIHAEEHATSAVALYTVHYLLTNYGTDEEVTRLLDQQVFYVLPRLNPDGAEVALRAPYYPWCGNGRFLPEHDRHTGLIPGDIDGDGFIVSMRVPDPKGEWKRARDPRLMVQREPGEEEGDFYRVYPEGLIRDYDGVHVPIERPFDGNLNRNFPVNWSGAEYGAGETALSEPESRALARFILDHPNIAGMNALHTHGGIILRPSMTQSDASMSPRDLALYTALGEVGTKLTGYPTISIFEEFTPDKSQPRRGGLMDWTYEEMGIISFATEVWDLETEAGVDKVAFYNLHPRTEEVQEKVFAWVLENVGEQGYRDWTPFEHPQLGPVEVGGMVYIWTYRNPPPALLRDLCHKNMRFLLHHAAAAPRVRVGDVRAEALGANLYKIRAVVSNHGYLPTNLSDVAIQKGTAKGVEVALEPNDAELVMNPPLVDLGHLAGRNERLYPWSPWGQQWSPVTKVAEWLVRGEAGSSVTVSAKSEKGGTHRLEVALGG